MIMIAWINLAYWVCTCAPWPSSWTFWCSFGRKIQLQTTFTSTTLSFLAHPFLTTFTTFPSRFLEHSSFSMTHHHVTQSCRLSTISCFRCNMWECGSKIWFWNAWWWAILTILSLSSGASAASDTFTSIKSAFNFFITFRLVSDAFCTYLMLWFVMVLTATTSWLQILLPCERYYNLR